MGVAHHIDAVSGGDKAERAEDAKCPRAGEGDFSGGEMAVLRARIGRIEFAIRDAVERHRASARGDHRQQDEAEEFPTRPAEFHQRHGFLRFGFQHGKPRPRRQHHRG